MKIQLFFLLVFSFHTAAHLIRHENSLDLSQWARGQKAHAEHIIDISIGLTPRNMDLGVSTLLDISDPTSPQYGHYLSAKQIFHMFQPKPSAVLDVMEWLTESGVDRDAVRISYSGGIISLSLPAQQAMALFGTTFYHHTHLVTGREQVTCQFYYIPRSLAESVDYVLAASPVQAQHLGRRKQSVLNKEMPSSAVLPSDCLSRTSVSCLKELYAIPDVQPHLNNSFGIFEPSWFSWRPEDLDQFFEAVQPDRVGHRPTVDAINGGYLQRNQTGQSWYLEPNLDFEYGMALTSPQEVTDIQVGSYQQLGNLQDMLAAFDRYFCYPVDPDDRKFPGGFYPPGCNDTVCDCGSSPPPKVLSISWGWDEANFTANYLQRQCVEFLKLGLMGTTVVVGSGDHGAAGSTGASCIDDKTGNGTGGRFGPSYPASCPWVTAVGGTQMRQPSNSLAPLTSIGESAWRANISGSMFSSGGGFSNVFRAPPYQLPAIQSYKQVDRSHLEEIHDRFNSTGRAYPDVALRADYYRVVVLGKWTVASGTSAAAPVFASIMTLINSERMSMGKGPVGFVNPVLYGNPGMLNDVVTGANEGCGTDPVFRATPGWDAVTGLGSPNYERIREVFLSLP